ncbi:MAG: hypothetical protein Q8Q23_05230 [bacterium]|nr:hypothetical protein [bacterium]
MSKATITAGQARSLIASFTIDTPWDEILVDIQPFIELTPSQRGQAFADFVRNGCRLDIGDVQSIITKPFNPAEFLGEGWTVWKGPADGDGLSGEEDIDPRSLALVKIEVSQFLFETCLQASAGSITGEEKLHRLKAKSDFVRFGANVFLGLWTDYQANKKNSVLERLYKERKVTYLDFPGTVLRNPDGIRRVPYLFRRGVGQWGWDCFWLGDGWGAASLSVGCAS